MSKRVYPILIFLVFLAAFFCLAYPLYVIRPFRSQGPRELALALAVLRIRPAVTLLAVLASAGLLVLYWRVQPILLGRRAAILATIGVIACALLSRVNVYEMMFHPMDAPSFEAASATKLAGKQMVMAVNMGGTSRAIRFASWLTITS